MRKKINPKLLNLIQKHFPNPDDASACLTYALCVEAETILTLYKWGLLKNEENEAKFRILLVDEDVDAIGSQRKYKLKIPLWTDEVEEDLYVKYYKAVFSDPSVVKAKGLLFNKPEGKGAFNDLVINNKPFDLQRLINCTIQYYKRTEYALSLPRFLNELAQGEYLSYQPVKSNLI